MDPTPISAHVRATILGAVRERAATEPAQILPDGDLFAQFGLNSMDTFAVIVKLERALGVVIGEEASDFDRAATFAGLESLLVEKVQASQRGAVA
jgi:acyl carrier protein